MRGGEGRSAGEGRSLGEELRIGALVAAGMLLSGALNRLCRFEVSAPFYAERRRRGEAARCLYAVWHESLWHLMFAMRGQGTRALVSSHRDGEIIARMLKRRGFSLVRGSSTRGGARALLELSRVARDSSDDAIITVDGPRGPARVVKEGILFAASRTGLPIVPLGVSASRAWRARSWDRLLIGKPFARVAVEVGDELRVPADAPRETLLAGHGALLAAALERAEERARRALDGAAASPPRAGGVC